MTKEATGAQGEVLGSCILQEGGSWVEAEDAEEVEPGEKGLKKEILRSFCV